MGAAGRDVGGATVPPRRNVEGTREPFVPYDQRPCVNVHVYRLTWTSQKRCAYILNSRRWRCKNAPTHYIEHRPDSTGMAVCEEHLAAMRADCE